MRLVCRQQALLRYEAATEEKRPQESEERKLVKLRERERKQALRDQQDGQCQIEGQRQFLKAKPRIDKDSQRLAATEIEERQAIWNDQEQARHRDREERDEAGAEALQRHKATVQAQRVQQRSLTEGRVVAFEGILPSFLEEEYGYMKQASTDFSEMSTPSIQMECMKAYQKAISNASRRLPCGLCGGLFQEDEMRSVGLQDDNLQYLRWQ